jgi:3-hydroxy-9,10-secoandrosta-1,3,5(10)-triene-9,17-dione monooxygenase reductase component
MLELTAETVSSVTPALYRDVLSTFATGVVVVSARERGAAVGMSVNAFAALSLQPPLISLAIGCSSRTWPKIRRSSGFCVSILNSDQAALCRLFSKPCANRFEKVAWTLSPHGSPIINGALAWIDCAITSEHTVGDHSLVIGEILALGRVGFGMPLVFYSSEFRSIEVPPGSRPPNP